MESGLVFDVKRYAINDGPGIRVTIFLKGCNLHCAWCHNPESISSKVEKLYSRDKCFLCGTCAEECPANAITVTKDGVVTDTELCKLCGHCAEVCPTKATEMSGTMKTVDEVMEIIEKERIFFDQSGGGVTFSGGEPLLHSEFLLELLKECGKRGIHRTVDTTGLAKTEILLEVAKHTDYFLYDLKMMDSEKHKKWTNVNNERILENLKILAETGAEINIRIPLMEGINDDDENITETAKFVANLAGNRKKVNILPYHNIARKKYEKLGRPDEFEELIEPSKGKQTQLIAQFAKFGLEAVIGG